MCGKTAKSKSKVTIPPEVLARYNSVNAQAQTAAAQPFQQYSTDPNAFVAPLTSTQQAGIAGTNAAANLAQPYFAGATGATLGGMGAANPEELDIERYMNPWLSNVVGSTAALLGQQREQDMSGALGSAAMRGAWGGDRVGLGMANLQQQQDLANSNILSNLLSQGFTNAQGVAQQQQGVDLAAQQANLARLLQGGGQLAQLGTGAQTAGLQGAEAQMAAGAQQQQTQQAGLSALYNQFQQQKAYPFQVAQFLANIAEGTGALSGSTTTTSQPSSFFGGLFSDRRLKEDVHRVGHTDKGLPIYKFRYKGDPEHKMHMGLMADEVEQVRPEAVGLARGFKTVDYDRATRATGGGVGLADIRKMASGGTAEDYLTTVMKQLYGGEAGFSPDSGMYGRSSGAPGERTYVPKASLPVGQLQTADTPAPEKQPGMQDVLDTTSNAQKSWDQLKHLFGPNIAPSQSAAGGARTGLAVGGTPYSNVSGYVPEADDSVIRKLATAKPPGQDSGGGLGDALKLATTIMGFFANGGVVRGGFADGGVPDDPYARHSFIENLAQGISASLGLAEDRNPDDIRRDAYAPFNMVSRKDDAFNTPKSVGLSPPPPVVEEKNGWSSVPRVPVDLGTTPEVTATAQTPNGQTITATPGVVPMPTYTRRPDGTLDVSYQDGKYPAPGVAPSVPPSVHGEATPTATAPAPATSVADDSERPSPGLVPAPSRVRRLASSQNLLPDVTGPVPQGGVVPPSQEGPAPSQEPPPGILPNGRLDPKAVRPFVLQTAKEMGIDPSVADRMLGQESSYGAAYVGDDNSSFGPLQLHYGNVSRRFPHAGLGDEFTRATGLDARDPTTWKDQVKFALAKAKEGGWSPWANTRDKFGFSNFEGIGEPGKVNVAYSAPGTRGAYTPTADTGTEGGGHGKAQGLLDRIFGGAEDKASGFMDTVKGNQNILLPLLSGLGTMASSPSRYFGTALLQGLGGGAKTYMDLQKQQADIGLTNAEALRTSHEAVAKAIVPVGGTYMVLLADGRMQNIMDWARNPLGPISGGPMANQMAQAIATDIGHRTGATPPAEQAPAGYTPAAATGETIKTTPTGIEGTTAPVTVGAGTPIPKGPTSVPPGVRFDPTAQAAAKAEEEHLYSPNYKSWQENSEAIKANSTANAEAARGQKQNFLNLTDVLSKGMQGQGFAVPGAGREFRSQLISMYNTLSRAAGGDNYSDADSLDQIVNKINSLSSLGRTTEAGQRSLGALAQAIEATPNLSQNPKATASIMANILTTQQQFIDRDNFFNTYARGNSAGTVTEAPKEFDRQYQQGEYEREKVILADLIGAKDPQLRKLLEMSIRGQIPPDKFQQAIYKVYGEGAPKDMYRYFTPGRQ